GSALPNSDTAKRDAYFLPSLSALFHLLPSYSTSFFACDAVGFVATMISGVLILTFSLFALVYAMRQAPRIVPFLIYPWLYLAFFVILNPLVFRWYMAPPLPALMLSAFVGAWVMLQPLTKTGARRLAYGIVGGLGLLCLFTSVNAGTLHPDHGLYRPAPRMAWHDLELLYERMVRHLRDELVVTWETRHALR